MTRRRLETRRVDDVDAWSHRDVCVGEGMSDITVGIGRPRRRRRHTLAVPEMPAVLARSGQHLDLLAEQSDRRAESLRFGVEVRRQVYQRLRVRLYADRQGGQADPSDGAQHDIRRDDRQVADDRRRRARPACDAGECPFSKARGDTADYVNFTRVFEPPGLTRSQALLCPFARRDLSRGAVDVGGRAGRNPFHLLVRVVLIRRLTGCVVGACTAWHTNLAFEDDTVRLRRRPPPSRMGSQRRFRHPGLEDLKHQGCEHNMMDTASRCLMSLGRFLLRKGRRSGVPTKKSNRPHPKG